MGLRLLLQIFYFLQISADIIAEITPTGVCKLNLAIVASRYL